MADIPKPKFKTHTFAQEIAIAEGQEKCAGNKKKPVEGYEFSNGRKFYDKVEKTKSYD
jgi:hypothetical protein